MEKDLGRAISGVDFPARKDDLLRRAKRNKASAEVIRKIESLPDTQYHSLERIWNILKMPSRSDHPLSVSPSQNTFFHETLDGALKELHFPATKEQLIEESRSVHFMWGKKDFVFSLSEVIEDLEEEVYRKSEEVMNEINTFIKRETGKL